MTVELVFEKFIVGMRVCKGLPSVLVELTDISEGSQFTAWTSNNCWAYYWLKNSYPPIQGHFVCTDREFLKSHSSLHEMTVELIFEKSMVGMHLFKGLSSVLTRISQKSQFPVLNDCETHFWKIYSSYAPIQGNCVCASWADRNDTARTRLDAQTWCSCSAGIYIFKFVNISVYICT